MKFKKIKINKMKFTKIYNLMTVRYIRENGKINKKMDMDSRYLMMDLIIMVYGDKIKCMEKVEEY